MKQHYCMKICEISEVLNGFSFKSSKYINEGIRIIRITNVQKGYIEDNNPVFYPADTVGIEKFMLHEDDLLVSLTGNVGRVGLLSKEFLPAALNQRVACLRVDDSLISSKYLFHYLNNDKFENDCIRNSNGIAQKNMSTEWLKKYEIVLYDRDAQDFIVKILDCILSLLNKTKYLISLYDKLVKSQFVEMFVNKYPMINLSSICTIIMGQSPSGATYNQSGIGLPFYQGKIDFGNNYIKSTSNYTSHPTKIAEAGDVLISVRAPVGSTNISICHCCIGRGLAAIRPNKNYSNTCYILYSLRYIEKEIENMGVGSTFKCISKNQIENLKVFQAPYNYQRIFSDFVNQVDKSKITYMLVIFKNHICDIIQIWQIFHF